MAPQALLNGRSQLGAVAALNLDALLRIGSLPIPPSRHTQHYALCTSHMQLPAAL